jgi:hypothetical protein
MPRLMTTDRGLALVNTDGEHVTPLLLFVADLGAALEAGMSVAEIAASPAGDEVSVGSVHVLPPVLRPSKIWALGLAYSSHVGEKGPSAGYGTVLLLEGTILTGRGWTGNRAAARRAGPGGLRR